MKFFIMRGASGSGKSTWHKANLPGAFVISTDDLHMENGIYVYKADKQSEFHNATLLKIVETLQKKVPLVVLDNTNTKMFELAPYYRLGEAFGYDTQIVWCITPPDICKARNVHKVPPQTIDHMILGVDPLPPWWKVKVVLN